MSSDNPWSGSTADRRLFRAVPVIGLTDAATAASANDPWLATVDATTAMAVDPGGGTTLRVRFLARDGFSQPSTQAVTIAVAGGRINSAAAQTGGGTVVAALDNGGVENDAANYGKTVVVTPNATTGKVDILFTFNAGATANVQVLHRHIQLGAQVTIA